MQTKHEDQLDERMVYAFIDLEADPPVTRVVPSRVVGGGTLNSGMMAQCGCWCSEGRGSWGVLWPRRLSVVAGR